MPLDNRDAAYIWDMLQAAREVVEMMGDHALDGFLENLMVERAVERSVEIIGEAARRVSGGGRTATPEIPWQDIIGQRNILAHEYGQIDHELLYKTATQDIPELIVMLEHTLPPLESK